jgi:hypothetical protein
MKHSLLIILTIVVITISCNNPKPSSTTIKTNDTVVEQIMPYDTFSYSAYNEIAHFLAGIPYNDSTTVLTQQFNSADWKQYAKDFSADWYSFDTAMLQKVTTWSATHITHTDSMFYPFSGPDFNYLNALFPNTRYSVLIGLEKPGTIPNIETLNTNETRSFLHELRNSLGYNLEYSFFRTKGMAKELNSELLDGTIPLIMLFMKRHGFDILNIYPVNINSEGWLEADTSKQMFVKDFNKTFENGVSFIYRDSNETKPRELIYLSLDISNGAIDTTQFDKFFTHYITGKTSFLKAASYLCHMPEFSIITEHLLSKSKQIVTDPSGMPYRNFDSTWNVTIHGNYVGPINLFWGRIQTDLRDTCKNRNCQNLPFRFGYHYTQWCMIDAKKK